MKKFLPIFSVMNEISPLYIWKSTWACHKTGHVMMRSYVLIIKIHFNIIISHMSKFSRWILSFRFPYQGPVPIPPPHHETRYMPNLPHPLLLGTTEKCRFATINFEVFLYIIFYSFLLHFHNWAETFSQTPFLKIFQAFFPLIWEKKFHVPPTYRSQFWSLY